jgi:hemerythrin-like domain-containing protein
MDARDGSGPGSGAGQPGLRKRMKSEVRRLSSQHRQLDDFFDMLVEALARDSLEGARAAFLRFRDALEAHVTLEDTVFFPAVHGLQPDLGDDLAELVAEHREFREQLEQLYEWIARGMREPFEEGIYALASRISDHELREEALLSRLTPAPPAG